MPRIGLTSPYGHPFVRRGIERYCSELGGWLAQQGHSVTWICTSPSPVDAVEPAQGFRVRYAPRGRQWGRGRLRLDELLSCFWPLTRAIHQEDLDVIESHHHVDGAATRVGRRRRTPYVLWIPGAPSAGWMAGQPLHRLALRVAMSGAARVHCISEYAQTELRDHFGIRADVLTPGVDTARYATAGPTAPEARILCTADPADRRKNIDVLVRAFQILCRHRGDARLVLAAHDHRPAKAITADLPAEVRCRIDVPRDLTFDELAQTYGEATVTVLPSRREAFGLVLVESLAAGTPVVGTDDGAIPEIITNDDVGFLFSAGDAEALARRLDEAIDLGRQPSTADACRRHARKWDWSSRGPAIERALLELAEDG